MKITATLLMISSLIALFNLASAVWVETCGPNAVYRREDGTLARRNVFTDCWATWSRCTGWSSAGTGTVWETCDDCCKKKGRNGGNCNLRPSKCPLTDQSYVCECY